MAWLALFVAIPLVYIVVMDVVVFDENARPGGQLFKQIHKFFGSKEHHAKVRGFRIGDELLKEADAAGVRVELDSSVLGLYPDREVVVRHGDEVFHAKGDAVLVATGASENTLGFPGWTLPGVIGAGAAQTMMNLHGVRPGDRVLMRCQWRKTSRLVPRYIRPTC